MRARERKPPCQLFLDNRWLPSLKIQNARREWHSLRAYSKAHAADVKVSIGNCPRCLRKSARRRALSEKGARKHKRVLRSMSGLVHVTNVGYSEAADMVPRARTCRDAPIRRLEKGEGA